MPFETRRLSFGAAAADYDRYRPTYPPAAVEWVLAAATGPVHRVADLGAGTGALSRVLCGLGLDVVAVEPDDGMREVLAARLPEVDALAGSAEALPLADASVDAVLVGQAWHWFDPDAAIRELRRVLRPGGVVGLLWNVRDDSVEWMTAYSDLVGGDDRLRLSRDAGSVPAELHAERAEFPNPVRRTPEELVGLTLTASYVRLRLDADVVAESVRELTRTYPQLAGRDELELRYATVTYRATFDTGPGGGR